MRCAALGMVVVGFLSGSALAGVPEPHDYRQDDYRAAVPTTIAGGRVVHTGALQALLARGAILLIDVLPAPRRPAGMRSDQPWMPVPRRDIPGSLWLPDTGRGALAPEFDRWFRERLVQATAGDKGHPMVFYCLSRCWMSWNAAKRAIGYGYRRVFWYPDGSDGWAQAGLPLAVTPPEPRPQGADGP